MNQRHRRAAGSGIDPEELHETLEQFQVAARHGDLRLAPQPRPESGRSHLATFKSPLFTCPRVLELTRLNLEVQRW
jgi:hypothetical protein